MADAESITFTSATQRAASAPRSTASPRSGRSDHRPHDASPSGTRRRAMGIEHRGVVTGRGRFTLAPAPGDRTRFTWTEELHVPVVDGRRGRRVRGQARAARGLAPQPAPPEAARRDAATRSSVRRMTNYAVSVAGMQTLGAELTPRRRARGRRARLHVGVGRGGERGRSHVAARRDQPGRAARRARHRRARAAAAHAAAARDGRGDAAAARGRPRRVPRRRHLVARGRRPVARRGLHRPADRAGARVRHAAARVPRAARP